MNIWRRSLAARAFIVLPKATDQVQPRGDQSKIKPKISAVPARLGGSIQAETRTRTLFLLALVFSAFQAVSQITPVMLFTPYGFTGSYFFAGAVAGSLISFLVSPVLLFYVFYRLGKSVVLSERYLRICVGVFLGGMIGYSVAYFLLPIAFGSVWGFAFPNLLSVVFSVPSLALFFVRAGLDTLFPAFVAVAIANYRTQTQRVSEQPTTESAPPESRTP